MRDLALAILLTVLGVALASVSMWVLIGSCITVTVTACISDPNHLAKGK